jgi:uncharacterized protein
MLLYQRQLPQTEGVGCGVGDAADALRNVQSEENAMTEVNELTQEQIEELLSRINYGHLACSLDDRPYVVPTNFAYASPFIYVYTTEGMKTNIIDKNPHVCLQIEEIVDSGEWQSVVVEGDAERITDRSERELALRLVRRTNPSLTPAISIRWVNNWIRENHEVVYRINLTGVSGRSATKTKVMATFAQPGSRRMN